MNPENQDAYYKALVRQAMITNILLAGIAGMLSSDNTRERSDLLQIARKEVEDME
jgi:hypothetical protein